MNFKKLTLAAAISVGMLTAGNAAQAQMEAVTTQAPAATNEAIAVPSAIGAGTAGSFSAYGTLPPVGGNAAGATEITTFRTSQPVGSTAAMAAQGIYGQCIPCQPATACPTGGAAVVPTTPVQPSEIIIQRPVATPQTSSFAGGAAAAEAQGLNCEVLPVIPNAPTGGAAFVPLTPPACVPGATTGVTDAGAPEGYGQPMNPGSALPATGGAANIVPIYPVAPTCPSAIMQFPTATGGAAVVVPTVPAVPAQPMVMQPAVPMVQPGVCPTTMVPLQPVTTPVQTNITCPVPLGGLCPTGGAAAVGPVTSTCAGINPNAEYIERQVYAYPALPNMNAYVPAAGDVISFGGINDRLSVIDPLSIAATPVYNPNVALYNSNIAYNPYLTGAAAPINTANITGCAANIPQIISGAPITLASTQGIASAPITIQTQSALQFTRTVLYPGQVIGAAAPITSQFVDVPTNFWASNQINKLASAGVIAGYPDRTFKPNLPVSRSEMASLLVSGLNLEATPTLPQQVFADVPNTHWANSDIDKVYNRGLVSGYPNDTFRPADSVSRAEALTTMARALPGEMTATQANQILSNYSDADTVPAWARISVAKAVNAGLLQGAPSPNMINPIQSATRADIAAMLSQLRQNLALEQPTMPTTTGAAASIQQETITAPVLNVRFDDRITSRSSHVGDTFTSATLEPVTINGVVFPAGSRVDGRVVEVVRPGNGSDGALKLAFTDINYGNQSAALPRDVLTAQVQAADTPMWRDVLSRVVEFPFVLPGRVLGTVGRTLGGMTVIAGNSSEQILSGFGTAGAELVNGEPGAAGRTALSSVGTIIRAPFEITRTALAGATGILGVSSDEIGYLIGANGSRVARINSDDRVAIAFGCAQ